MSHTLCMRCLKQSLRSVESSSTSSIIQRSSLSTSASLAAKAAPPKKGGAVKPGGKATKTLRLSKNVRQSSGKPPEPGERKAVRKRIVLSNTNALEVKGLQDLTGDKLLRHSEGTVTLDQFRGQMLGLNDDTVDALRALEAFKPTQGWSLFRRPATLVRKETAALANDLADIAADGKKVIRKVAFGAPGSGKSVLVLQAQAMAFLRDWLVVHFPEGQDMVIAQTSYQPVNSPSGITYIQPHYTAKLLKSIATANRALLSSMQLSRQHRLPIPIQPNMSLARFAELGAQDPEIAWPIWQALWTELTAPSSSDEAFLQRPPMLITMDGIDQIMRKSAYLDPNAKPIHAHDLALVQSFNGFLSGKTPLPNGGMVLAATCASNRAASPTLDYELKTSVVRQTQKQQPQEDQTDGVAAPQWDPWVVRDERVGFALEGVEAIELRGLSKSEARGVMEYYARSGILRGAVTDTLVGEKWTLAGSGNIGELEKGTVKARF